MRLSDYSVKSRLYALGAFSCLSLLAVQGLALYALFSVRIGGPAYQRIGVLKDLQADISPPPLTARGAFIVAQEVENEARPEEIRRQIERFGEFEALFQKTYADYLARIPEGELKRGLVSEVYPTGADVFRQVREVYFPLVGKPDKQAEASRYMAQQFRPLYDRHTDATTRLLAAIERQTESETKAALDESRQWGNWMIGITVVSVLLAILFGGALARGIVRSLNLLTARVREMAGGAGDLTARVDIQSRDELGQLASEINGMIAKIQAVVTGVRASSLQVLATASQIAATSRQQESTVNGLSSAATQVAAAVREISATGKELSGTMDEVSGRATQAASLAAAGQQGLGGMERTMQQLVESTAGISGKLATIREKADTINSVVTTITKVADQTNLLSINAAIEAEKAGEFGRGFLVVAREIRRLADQTAVATLDIEGIVKLMQDAVAAGVMQMDKFSDEVRTSVGRVADLNGQTGEVISEVSALSDRFRSVNEGMRNQATGAEQINDAMGHMSGNIRQTAGALEEFNRATAHLRESIEGLNKEIAQFKV